MRQGNNYQIEGIDNNERSRNLQNLIPPAEAIQVDSAAEKAHGDEARGQTGLLSRPVN
jgi:hypothetical protein